jgi:hypothetical protein
MDELTIKELTKVLGGQTMDEIGLEFTSSKTTTVNWIACCNTRPCNAIDVALCTVFEPFNR